MVPVKKLAICLLRVAVSLPGEVSFKLSACEPLQVAEGDATRLRALCGLPHSVTTPRVGQAQVGGLRDCSLSLSLQAWQRRRSRVCLPSRSRTTTRTTLVDLLPDSQLSAGVRLRSR